MSDTRDINGTLPAGGKTLPSVLLGIFILWELFYLPAANFIKLLPVRVPPHKGELDDDVQLPADESAGGLAQAGRDGLAFGLSRWGELTGQTQGWALFAPTFGHQASLPMVGFGLKSYPSPFRPTDPHVYFRRPEPSCRLFNYEYRLALLYWRWKSDVVWANQEEWKRVQAEWQRALEQRVRWQHRSMLAYMRWRVDNYLRDNPGAVMPSGVELYAETIPSPPPEAPHAMRRNPMSFSLAQWLPGISPPPGCLPIKVRTGPGGWVWLPEED